VIDGAPHAALVAAGIVIALLLAAEAWLLARLLAWRRGEPARGLARALWAVPLGAAVLFAVPAGIVARSGALAPGVSGAGMPWERITDAAPFADAARAGERPYLNRCAPCHLPNGRGLPPSYPPLAGSHVLAGPSAEHARIALYGSAALAHHHEGAGQMPAFEGAASDAELAAILTYERSAFGIPGSDGLPDSTSAHVRPSDVARARAAGPR